jgi:polyhydroxyalkanoate synthesis regulator phasin
MNEEKMKILNMISEGKITAEEGARLMDALDKKEETKTEHSPVPVAEKKNEAGQYLYVDVTPKTDKNGEKVHVKVPMALLRAGVNIVSLLPKDIQKTVDGALDEKGLGFDFSSLKPENIEQLIEALGEMEVNVDADDYTVRVFCA